MPIKNQGMSTLFGKTGVIVGHGAGPHPFNKPAFMSIFIVRTDDQWVICLSEGAGEYDWDGARDGLGNFIKGEDFARHAARGIGIEVDYPEVRRLLTESFKDKFTLEWIDNDETPWDQLPPDKRIISP